MMRHLIVGGGPAGQCALQTIRALDRDAEISLVCDEPAYARMVLPYYLEGKIEERAVLTADTDWYAEQRVETHFGRRVVAIDPGGGSVALDGGETLEFDRLLIATGSRAARPPIPGLAGDGVVNMWTLDDAKAFLEKPRGETVIVGAGFIAFTVLDAIVARSEKVSFVEIESQILPRMLDATAAAQMAAHLEARGIAIHTGTSVDAIEDDGGRRSLRLGNGERLLADAVVVAAGIQPNTELVAGSGITTGAGPGAGILVDDHLQTSAANVYAAGDVAEGFDLLTGEQRVHAIQPTAVDHGRVAGANMVGSDVTYAGSLTMNILAAQGLEACSFGDWAGDGREVHTALNAPNRIYRKYVFDGNKMVGGALVGPTLSVTGVNDVGMLKGLVQTGVPLGPWKAYLLENPLDLRRVYVASGAAKQLLASTLLTGSASAGGGFRFPALPPTRKRSKHHETLLEGKSAPA